MSPEQALAELAKCHTGDTEGDHAEADRILCDLLKALGHADVVAAYDKVDKWYA